ncbi:MAG: hypothetical protein ACOYZ7_00595 [Chloroflexota bacterium]
MPDLTHILASLPPITITTAIAGLFITGGLLILLRQWAHALLALIVQYLLLAWLLATIIPLALVVVKVMTGAIACAILYWSARRIGEPSLSPFKPLTTSQAAQRKLTTARRQAFRVATGFTLRLPFRMGALSLAAIAAYALVKRYPLPGTLPALGLACTWLATVALTVLALAESPFHVGTGLLTWLMAFDAFYVAWERSLTIASLLGIATLFVALGAGYLISVRGTLPAEALSEEGT